MIGGNFTLIIAQGANYYQSFQWKLPGSKKNPLDGVPVNLYGYTGRCHIRNGAQNPGIILIIPVEIINEKEGRFAINLTAEQTGKIPTTGTIYSETEKYAYDIELINSAGTVYRILNGVVLVSPEVTR